jgi:hypothetical protein
MKIQSNETISMFNRRFSSLYYNIPKEIQLTKVVAMLHYARTFHMDLSFLLMKRRSKTLQKKFDDSQEVEDNLQACQRLQNHYLEEVANARKNGETEEHEIVHKQEVDLHPGLFKREQKIDRSMKFF